MNRNICLLCTKLVEDKTKRLTDIFKNKSLLRIISKATGTTIKPDPSLPDTICAECMMRVNYFFEFQTRIRKNILKLHINYYIKTNNLEKVAKYKKQIGPDLNVKIHQFKEHLSPGRTTDGNILISNVRSENAASEISSTTKTATAANNNGMLVDDENDNNYEENTNICEDNGSDDVVSTTADDGELSAMDTSSSNLLKPMYQTMENLKDTESGGSIHQQNDEITARRCDIKHKCEFCSKVYHKSFYLRKHMRKHYKEQQQKMQNESTETKMPVEKIEYKCEVPDCGKVYRSMPAFRKHCLLHEKKYICPGCQKKYTLNYDYTWHVISCALASKQKDQIQNGTNRRQTRSQSRSVCSNYTTDDESVHSRSSAGTHNTSRQDSLYNERMLLTNFTKEITGAEIPPNKKVNLDNISIMSSMSDLTCISNSSNSSDCSSVKSNSEKHMDGRQKNYQRLRKHREAKRQANQNGSDYYMCSYIDECSYGCTSMAQLMYHEQMEHKALLQHNCGECNEWFTSRENLIRHRKRHVFSEIFCLLCKEKFSNKYDLEYHTKLHHDKSFPCRVCRMSFLKMSALESHMWKVHKNTDLVRHPILVRRKSIHLKALEEPTFKNLVKFTGYKTKQMIQMCGNSRTNPTNSDFRLGRVYRKKIGNVASVDGVNSSETIWVEGTKVTGRRRRRNFIRHSSPQVANSTISTGTHMDEFSLSCDEISVCDHVPDSNIISPLSYSSVFTQPLIPDISIKQEDCLTEKSQNNIDLDIAAGVELEPLGALSFLGRNVEPTEEPDPPSPRKSTISQSPIDEFNLFSIDDL